MCKHAVKKLPCVIRHVPDQYKTQQMWNKAIIENSGTSDSVPICHKNQEIHDNPLDNYPRAWKFVLDSYITQTLCDKSVNSYHSTIQFVPDNYKTQ